MYEVVKMHLFLCGVIVISNFHPNATLEIIEKR
jgi:hypothetical protein